MELVMLIDRHPKQIDARRQAETSINSLIA